MKNSIDATVTFSFKGETYTPSTSIDLDALMEQQGGLLHLHHFLAVEMVLTHTPTCMR